MKVRTTFIILSILVLAIIAIIATFYKPILWSLIPIGPLVILGYSDILQKKQTIKRNFPVLGHFRYMLEAIRPEIMQYFVETDTEGTPINRQFRSLIYQRAKKVNDTVPFGTQLNVYKSGYEWMDHSMYARGDKEINDKPRKMVGGPDCKKPYLASILNISAMSFGSLSKNAIMALNKGAKKGRFAHNTGEGSISPYHLKYGGD